MKQVGLDHACQALSAWTGIAVDRLRPEGFRIGDPDELRAVFQEAIFGQDAAIDRVIRAIFRRTRLAPRNGEHRPLDSMLFAGPSGVGKTELAKLLARTLFGDDKSNLIRFDLSDFSEEHTIARLVGSPPGYVGHGTGGELTNGIRRVRFGVLLFDEVEKAHPSIVTQVLLPTLGEGVVHDMNDGSTLDVSQFLVIMTSNLGTSPPARTYVGLVAPPEDDPAQQVQRAIAGFFPNEVLGRIDDVIVFEELSEEAVARLWEGETEQLQQRLSAASRPLHLRIEREVSARLLERARVQVKAEGARAVRKLFDRSITDHCLELLGEEIPAGTLTVSRDDGGGIRFIFNEIGPAC